MRIQRAPENTMRDFATALGLAALGSLAGLAGCAKTVNIKPAGTYLEQGAYRSQTMAQSGGRQYRLDLKRDGRYALRAFASGCLVREERGLWSSTEEYLDLNAREIHARETCASPLAAAARAETYSCPIRKLSDKAFQMIHEEISQGTQWTEWTLASVGDFAEAAPMQGDRSLSAAR